MKSNELRVGNKIIANGLHGGREMTVEQIGGLGSMKDDGIRVILFKEHEVGEFCKDCIGIPLDETWLKRFGVTKDSHGFGFEMMPVNGRTPIHARWITEKLMGDKLETPFLRFDCTHTDIYFVHQFQNYIYALTNEELTLNETE